MTERFSSSVYFFFFTSFWGSGGGTALSLRCSQGHFRVWPLTEEVCLFVGDDRGEMGLLLLLLCLSTEKKPYETIAPEIADVSFCLYLASHLHATRKTELRGITRFDEL